MKKKLISTTRLVQLDVLGNVFNGIHIRPEALVQSDR